MKQIIREGRHGLAHRAEHDPRAAALLALLEITQGMDAQASLDKALASPNLVPTDKRLCTELVYGSLRYSIRLFWYMRHFLRKPEKLPQELLEALALALYQLALLRTAPHAVVHWTVSHIRHRFGSGLANLANGVLRNIQRSLKDFSSFAFYARHCRDPLEAKAIFYAMPEWLTKLWNEQYGKEESELLLAASLEVPPAGLRINPLCQGSESAREALVATATQQAIPFQEIPPHAFSFWGSLPWNGRILLAEGKAHRQSPASYQALMAMEPWTWQRPIWDACCGRGGKTLALIEAGIPVALASDPSPRRLAGLQQSLQSYTQVVEHLPAVRCRSVLDVEDDSGQAADSPQLFGSILLDVPCSGLGTLSRRPEIRLRRTPESIAPLVELQSSLMDAAWSRLQSGGSLIYLTCTRNRLENEEQVAAFQNRNADAALKICFQTPADSPLREFFFAALLAK